MSQLATLMRAATHYPPSMSQLATTIRAATHILETQLTVTVVDDTVDPGCESTCFCMCLVIDPRSFGLLRQSLCNLCYKYFLEHYMRAGV